MNTNESNNLSRTNSAELSDDGCAAMTDEELLLYREVLAEAYPKPSRDIKAGVMTAVRRDAALKRKRAQIFSPSSIMRWGGLAASIVLVAAVGIRVLPAFLTQDNLVSEADAQSESVFGITTVYTLQDQEGDSAKKSLEITLPSPADQTDDAGGEYSAMSDEAADDSNGNSGEENAVYTSTTEMSAEDVHADETAPADDTDTSSSDVPEYAASDGGEEITDDTADAADESETTAETDSAAGESGDTEESASAETELPDGDETAETEPAESEIVIAQCTHTGVYADSYHVIPDVLIEHVGDENYRIWADENKASSESCGPDIRSFIDHFGITESAFSYYLITTDLAYLYDYPLDILYGSAEECENYYTSGGQYENMLADCFEHKLKLALANAIGTEAYDAWLEKFPYKTIRAWSIYEFVNENNIPAQQFYEIYDETAEKFMREYDVDSVHEYDSVRLYVNSVQIRLALGASQLGYNVDVLCRK